MIIKNQQDVTEAVLAEVQRAEDPRVRELLAEAVRHLHAFVRETRLTEAEFQQVCGAIARLGQMTTASHNEVVLVCGSLGISSLVCLLNNGERGRTETTANLLGPFWRTDSPPYPNGASLLRSATAGVPIFVKAWVRDTQGRPVEGAKVDVWHASDGGYYENQDPAQADMNLRGQFTTDARGAISFRSIKPAGYPIPVDGPVGALFRLLGRHNMRPAHIHFLIFREGYKTQYSQVYSNDDPHLETDAQFGVTQTLIGQYVLHRDEPAPSTDVTGAWYSLDHHFVIEPGEARLPRAPITGKAAGERPTVTVLTRRS